MKRLLIFLTVIIIHSHSGIKSQDAEDNFSFIKSIQGTWAYTEDGAELWLKVVIKGHTLKGYAAYPKSGKFIAESSNKIREVQLKYRSKVDKRLKSESYAQIRKSTLSNDRIYLGIDEGKPYIVFGDEDAPKLIKVPSNFNPWK